MKACAFFGHRDWAQRKVIKKSIDKVNYVIVGAQKAGAVHIGRANMPRKEENNPSNQRKK